MQLPATLGKPVLSPTPSDDMWEFLSNNRTAGSETPNWQSYWAISQEDIEAAGKREVERQNLLHYFIASEFLYLTDILQVRYYWKYLSLLNMRKPSSEWIRNKDFKDDLGIEDIYHANETLLYDRLKILQSNEGPWLSGYWGVLRNWLQQSVDCYIQYMSSCHLRRDSLRNLEPPLAPDEDLEVLWRLELYVFFFKFPTEHLVHMLRYLRLILRVSDKDSPSHRYGELEELIWYMNGFINHCNLVLEKGVERVDIELAMSSDVKNASSKGKVPRQ